MHKSRGDRINAFLVSAALLLLAGCATTKSDLNPITSLTAPPALTSPEIRDKVFSDQAKPDVPQGTENALLPEATAFTPSQVQSIARQKNPTFAVFEANRQAARAERLQALAFPNPDLEIGLDATLAVFQPIEFPGARKTRRIASEASQTIVDRAENVFRTTLAAEVARSYYTVLYYEHAVALAKDSLRTEQEIDQVVEHRVDGGEAPEIDRIKAQVELLKASRIVQAHERQRLSARAVLNTLCGRALPPNFALEDALELPLSGVDEDTTKQIALAQHPLLLQLQAVVRQKELLIEREEKSWLPSLRFGIPPGLEIPLWNRNKGGIEAAKAELQKAQAELERTRQEILQDLETKTQNYESAREQLAAFHGGLRAAAAESLRIETFRYQEGEVDFLQLLDARRTARQTEVEYLQTLYDAQIARIELELAIGLGGEKE